MTGATPAQSGRVFGAQARDEPRRDVGLGVSRPPHSNTFRTSPNRAAPQPPRRIAPPVARPGKGASLVECLEAMEEALAADGPGFIAFTVMWRRFLALDDDRAIAREQAALIHRLRRVLARRGCRRALIFSVLERTEKHGPHGHIMAQAPSVEDHEGILDSVEDGLRKRFGRLRPRAFNRDGRRWKGHPRPRGSIWTERQARGALAYRLKSLPLDAEEHGVRRGIGLRPVECISLKVSRGRCRAG
jgi:hypothetical protein